MIFAQLPGIQWLVPALAVLAVILLMRRKNGRGRASAGGSAAGSLHTQQNAISQVQKMEVRLYDFGREVEGRIQRNLATLDQLIAESDREIVRLQDELETWRRRGSTAGPRQALPAGTGQEPLNAEQRQMIRLLTDAGYTVDEVAQLVERHPHDVRAVLYDEADQSGAAAA